MPRYKEFCEREVLARATDAFCRHGFEATSIQILVSEMKINRGSLYDTFGDKEGLFLRVMNSYWEERVAPRLKTLEGAGRGKEGILLFVETIMTEILSERGRYGCLLVNAAAERAPHDPEVASKLRLYWERIESVLERTLRLAVEQGDTTIDPDEISSVSRYLLTTLQGLRVVSKVVRDEAALRGVLSVALTPLGWKREVSVQGVAANSAGMP